MSTLLAILVLAALFAVFALLGPAERGRSCSGRRVGEEPCGRCPKASPSGRKSGNWPGCSGAFVQEDSEEDSTPPVRLLG